MNRMILYLLLSSTAALAFNGRCNKKLTYVEDITGAHDGPDVVEQSDNVTAAFFRVVNDMGLIDSLKVKFSIRGPSSFAADQPCAQIRNFRAYRARKVSDELHALDYRKHIADEARGGSKQNVDLATCYKWMLFQSNYTDGMVLVSFPKSNYENIGSSEVKYLIRQKPYRCQKMYGVFVEGAPRIDMYRRAYSNATFVVSESDLRKPPEEHLDGRSGRYSAGSIEENFRKILDHYCREDNYPPCNDMLDPADPGEPVEVKKGSISVLEIVVIIAGIIFAIMAIALIVYCIKSKEKEPEVPETPV